MNNHIPISFGLKNLGAVVLFLVGMPAHYQLSLVNEGDWGGLLAAWWMPLSECLWDCEWMAFPRRDRTLLNSLRVSCELMRAVDDLVDCLYTDYALDGYSYPSDESER